MIGNQKECKRTVHFASGCILKGVLPSRNEVMCFSLYQIPGKIQLPTPVHQVVAIQYKTTSAVTAEGVNQEEQLMGDSVWSD